MMLAVHEASVLFGWEHLSLNRGAVVQDPVLFSGTLRSNMDPEGVWPDHKLWEALKAVQLNDAVVKVCIAALSLQHLYPLHCYHHCRFLLKGLHMFWHAVTSKEDILLRHELALVWCCICPVQLACQMTDSRAHKLDADLVLHNTVCFDCTGHQL